MELSNIQEAKVNMFDRRDLCYYNNRTLFNGDPLTASKKTAIVNNRVLLDKAIAEKLADTSGNAAQKQHLWKLAAVTIGDKARACADYFHGIADFATEKILLKPKSYYTELKQDEIVTILKAVRKILFDNQLVLALYHVDAPYILLADGQIEALRLAIPVAGTAIDEKSAADGDIDKYIAIADKLYDQLDAIIINAFNLAHPDEVTQWLASAGINTVGVRHNIIDVSVSTGTPPVGINRALITIIEPTTMEVIKTIYTDIYGLAEFFSPNRALYINISAPSMITQRHIFKPIYRGTLHLDFILLPI